jgi:hypothetical protein
LKHGCFDSEIKMTKDTQIHHRRFWHLPSTETRTSSKFASAVALLDAEQMRCSSTQGWEFVGTLFW